MPAEITNSSRLIPRATASWGIGVLCVLSFPLLSCTMSNSGDEPPGAATEPTSSDPVVRYLDSVGALRDSITGQLDALKPEVDAANANHDFSDIGSTIRDIPAYSATVQMLQAPSCAEDFQTDLDSEVETFDSVMDAFGVVADYVANADPPKGVPVVLGQPPNLPAVLRDDRIRALREMCGH